jgi:hypothetical protein
VPLGSVYFCLFFGVIAWFILAVQKGTFFISLEEDSSGVLTFYYLPMFLVEETCTFAKNNETCPF